MMTAEFLGLFGGFIPSFALTLFFAAINIYQWWKS